MSNPEFTFPSVEAELLDRKVRQLPFNPVLARVCHTLLEEAGVIYDPAPVYTLAEKARVQPIRFLSVFIEGAGHKYDLHDSILKSNFRDRRYIALTPIGESYGKLHEDPKDDEVNKNLKFPYSEFYILQGLSSGGKSLVAGDPQSKPLAEIHDKLYRLAINHGPIGKQSIARAMKRLEKIDCIKISGTRTENVKAQKLAITEEGEKFLGRLSKDFDKRPRENTDYSLSRELATDIDFMQNELENMKKYLGESYTPVAFSEDMGGEQLEKIKNDLAETMRELEERINMRSKYRPRKY